MDLLFLEWLASLPRRPAQSSYASCPHGKKPISKELWQQLPLGPSLHAIVQEKSDARKLGVRDQAVFAVSCSCGKPAFQGKLLLWVPVVA